MNNWWNSNPGIQDIDCIPFIEYEPYLLWHHDDSSILYDERFFDYGFDKISHMNNLRMNSFRFHTILGVFGFDLPHPL